MRLPAPSLGLAQALEDADYNVAVDMLTESAFDPTVDRSKKVHTLFLWAPIGLHLRTPPPGLVLGCLFLGGTFSGRT